ncbi:MAG: ribosome-associated translation inhibitor RaiA [Prevotellaceae bacterium]|jgi:putative sigma-54 modulation protein|nr:ribosome-associated translation inhibitor RaiA [Prevotellaceae bacterium]
MEITIQAIKFDATDKLNGYIEKKMGKLEKFFDKAISSEVYLKVIKPETADNKQAEVTLFVPNKKLFASKTANSFEQAIDECVAALEKQIEKKKEKNSFSFKNLAKFIRQKPTLNDDN